MSRDELIETHISRVLLRGDRVYKRLKPVAFPFVDFSTLEKRKAACEAELLHNRPWAPGIYLEVVPVSGEPPVFGTSGRPDDYAIVMKRLPDAARVSDRAASIDAEAIRAIGRHIRGVHDSRPERPGSAVPDAVRGRILENLDELLALELPLSAQRVERATRGALDRAADALAERADTGRQLHGDLRTEHVYQLDREGLPPIAILDGVAFNDSLAEGDPVEDVAFLAMELSALHGRWDLEEALWSAWGADAIPQELRDLYAGHRALIRAKVCILSGKEGRRVTRLLAHALTRLELPAERPALVGVGGLPGVGKSTLSGLLERFGGFTILRSDVVRKQRDAEPEYTLAARDAVYDALLEAAETHLAQGERVVVDASFSRDSWREGLIEAARRRGVRAAMLFGHASEEVVAARLAARVNDPSDADLAIYHKARHSWEPLGERSRFISRAIDTGATQSQALYDAIDALEDLGIGAATLAQPPGTASESERRNS